MSIQDFFLADKMPRMASREAGKMDWGDLFFGSKPEWRKESLLSENQNPLLQQLLDALTGNSSGGAFGDLSNYYKDLFSNDSETFNKLSAPEMRRYYEDIVPGLAEQFAGMGSGGLSSSGFRNAALQSGTDLSERLGAIRAGLRGQGAQGLTQMGQMGLQPYHENVYMPGSPGLAHHFAKGAGGAAMSGMAGGM